MRTLIPVAALAAALVTAAPAAPDAETPAPRLTLLAPE